LVLKVVIYSFPMNARMLKMGRKKWRNEEISCTSPLVSLIKKLKLNYSTNTGRSLLSPHIPQGIHMESISFQVNSTHFTWNMFWVISQPFWWFHSTYIPHGFHHSIWNDALKSTWNYDINSTTVPPGFHPIPHGIKE